MNPSIQHVHIAKSRGQRAPRIIPAGDFDDAFRLSSSKPNIVRACRSILVDGEPWERACESHGVSLAGVWRAMKRHGMR